MAIIAAQRAGPGSGVEAKQSSAWMEILCMPSEKGKARRGMPGLMRETKDR